MRHGIRAYLQKFIKKEKKTKYNYNTNNISAKLKFERFLRPSLLVLSFIFLAIIWNFKLFVVSDRYPIISGATTNVWRKAFSCYWYSRQSRKSKHYWQVSMWFSFNDNSIDCLLQRTIMHNAFKCYNPTVYYLLGQ